MSDRMDSVQVQRLALLITGCAAFAMMAAGLSLYRRLGCTVRPEVGLPLPLGRLIACVEFGAFRGP